MDDFLLCFTQLKLEESYAFVVHYFLLRINPPRVALVVVLEYFLSQGGVLHVGLTQNKLVYVDCYAKK